MRYLLIRTYIPRLIRPLTHSQGRVQTSTSTTAAMTAMALAHPQLCPRTAWSLLPLLDQSIRHHSRRAPTPAPARAAVTFQIMSFPPSLRCHCRTLHRRLLFRCRRRRYLRSDLLLQLEVNITRHRGNELLQYPVRAPGNRLRLGQRW
jgi:hypothetical protein